VQTRIQRGDLESKALPRCWIRLSPRELQVLRLGGPKAKTSKEIAVMLDLGLQTVRSYRKDHDEERSA